MAPCSPAAIRAVDLEAAEGERRAGDDAEPDDHLAPAARVLGGKRKERAQAERGHVAGATAAVGRRLDEMSGAGREQRRAYGEQ